MHFLKSLPFFVFPAFVLANPRAAPYPLPAPMPDLAHTPVLIERQLDLSNLTGFLGSLTGSIQAIESLLSPTSIENIEVVVDGLSLVLGNGTAQELKTLLNTVGGLVTPSFISSVGSLLTPALITNVTDILGNAHDLLTPTFVSETKELIGDVAPLVSAISQVISVLLSAVLG